MWGLQHFRRLEKVSMKESCYKNSVVPLKFQDKNDARFQKSLDGVIGRYQEFPLDCS